MKLDPILQAYGALNAIDRCEQFTQTMWHQCMKARVVLEQALKDEGIDIPIDQETNHDND